MQGIPKSTSATTMVPWRQHGLLTWRFVRVFHWYSGRIVVRGLWRWNCRVSSYQLIWLSSQKRVNIVWVCAECRSLSGFSHRSSTSRAFIIDSQCEDRRFLFFFSVCELPLVTCRLLSHEQLFFYLHMGSMRTVIMLSSAKSVHKRDGFSRDQ